MKRAIKKIKILKIKYRRRASKKVKLLVGLAVFSFVVAVLLTFLQSSFFFCKILLPGICKIYNIEISADKIDVSLLSPKFAMHNITLRDNQIHSELKIDTISGDFRKWRLFSKEYYFRSLKINNIQLYLVKNNKVAHGNSSEENKIIDQEAAAQVFNGQKSSDFIAELPNKIATLVQSNYFQERFPNLVIDNLDIDNLNLYFKYKVSENFGEIIVSKLNFDLIKHELTTEVTANGDISIQEPFSGITKQGTLSIDLSLQDKREVSEYYFENKIFIDLPESKEKFICSFSFDSTNIAEGSFCNFKLESFKEEKLTSLIKLNSFWKDHLNFHIKLHEAFVSPELTKFASELFYGKSFGIFDGKVSGILLSNQDEFIFNFFAKVNRAADRDLKKMELTADISSRYNRSENQLIVNSCYGNLLLDNHQLLTMTTPSKYIYQAGKDVNLENFKFDISIDKFDLKIIDYFCLYDSNFRFIDGKVSAKICSEFNLKEKIIHSSIDGVVDRLHSTLYGDDYFEFNGYFDLATALFVSNLYLKAESKKICFVNNLQENLFVADASGAGWADLRNWTCDFQIDIYNGNARVFDTFAITRNYIANFPYLNNYLYSLNCHLSVLNDKTFDLLNSCFTVKDAATNHKLLVATATPIELEISTECETNLNPIYIKVDINDKKGEILGNYYKGLSNLPSTMHCEMEFAEKFQDWKIFNLYWQIFPDSQTKESIFAASGNLLMNFDTDYETTAKIKIEKINDLFAERFLGYDFCNKLIGDAEFNFKFFNDFKNSELKSNIMLREAKFLSHPDNVFAAELQSFWTFKNSYIDRCENFLFAQIDGNQTLATDLHRINSNNREKIEFDWGITYLDLLSLHKILSAFKKEDIEEKIEQYLDSAENKKTLTADTQKADCFNFKDNLSIRCNFDNISYNSENTIKFNGIFDCINNVIKTEKALLLINDNQLRCDLNIKAAGENVEITTKINTDELFLPLINKVSENNEKKKEMRGEINDFSLDFQTKITAKKHSFFDNLSGIVKGNIKTLIIPNSMTDSFIGNILVYSFEFAAKLIDLLPTRLSFLQGYINLVTKFNENRYYEILFNDGIFEFNCKNGVFAIEKLSMKGEAIDSFDCAGKVSIGSEPYLDIISEAEINNIVFPLYFEGVLEDPEINMTKSIGAFMKNIFDIF